MLKYLEMKLLNYFFPGLLIFLLSGVNQDQPDEKRVFRERIDRIREDRKFMRRASEEEIINTSINQTLSRTALTSLTTLLVVLALFVFGGKVINDFSFVLLIGVLVGTYSSIFIASPILIDWPSRRSGKR